MSHKNPTTFSKDPSVQALRAYLLDGVPAGQKIAVSPNFLLHIIDAMKTQDALIERLLEGLEGKAPV